MGTGFAGLAGGMGGSGCRFSHLGCRRFCTIGSSFFGMVCILSGIPSLFCIGNIRRAVIWLWKLLVCGLCRISHVCCFTALF